ncbi:MAG: hypothetical protein OIF34_05595 [Porticoccaceae bacterium]|nr:hypothetical protein [Porticoccaceae bacterium]
MNYLITLILTLSLVAAALWLFARIGTPVYRIQRDNVVTLLQMVVDGTATESDWDVFLGVPIQHDGELEQVREHCAEISEREFIGGSGKLFTERGIAEITEVLESLK